jgi:hypothetical protein
VNNIGMVCNSDGMSSEQFGRLPPKIKRVIRQNQVLFRISGFAVFSCSASVLRSRLSWMALPWYRSALCAIVEFLRLFVWDVLCLERPARAHWLTHASTDSACSDGCRDPGRSFCGSGIFEDTAQALIGQGHVGAGPAGF